MLSGVSIYKSLVGQNSPETGIIYNTNLNCKNRVTKLLQAKMQAFEGFLTAAPNALASYFRRSLDLFNQYKLCSFSRSINKQHSGYKYISNTLGI